MVSLGILASLAALSLWDYESWAKLSARQAEVARSSGALSPLATALNMQRVMATLSGDVELATSLGVEEDALRKALGTSRTSYGALVLAAYRGRADQATRLIAKAADEALARGEGLGQQGAYLATAILNNGLGRYTTALTAALRSVQEDYVTFTRWGLAEVVESAVRSGRPELADDALQRLTAVTVEGSDWAAAIEARSRALVSKGTVADGCYREAVERFARTPLRAELARSTCCTASGCVARTDGWMPVINCEPLTTCSPEWVPRPSPSVPAGNCWPWVTRSADANLTLRTISPHRNSTSLGWHETDAQMARSARSSTSAPVPSSGTCARSSRSCTSLRVGASRTPYRPAASTPHRASSIPCPPTGGIPGRPCQSRSKSIKCWTRLVHA
ncbi:MAG: hypothetical protein QOF10_4494 [Kribbellaceae bacterium]|nr:hypothetical protein [Kribbellaceae bacterium]